MWVLGTQAGVINPGPVRLNFPIRPSFLIWLQTRMTHVAAEKEVMPGPYIAQRLVDVWNIRSTAKGPPA